MTEIMRKLINKRNIALFGTLVLLVILPLFFKNNYITVALVTCFSYAALGTSWNIIGGYARQTSWCHAAFMAIGAYSGMILYKSFNTSPFISLFVGIVLTVIFAFIIGNACFRLNGMFFSISTIAFLELCRILLLYFNDFTGGSNGMFVSYKGDSFWHLQFGNDKPYYYIMLTVMIFSLFVSYLVNKSKMGYYLKGIRDDEIAAEFLGINIHRIKLKAFIISAALTSVIGTFYGFFVTYIDPTSVCSMDISLRIGMVALIGGVGTLWGPIIGAFLLILLTQFMNTVFGSQANGISTLLFGLVLMIIVIFKPGGIITLFQKKDKTVNKVQRGKA
jgi:ABC-type branched-chain amino acid transport system, permease component